MKNPFKNMTLIEFFIILAVIGIIASVFFSGHYYDMTPQERLEYNCRYSNDSYACAALMNGGEVYPIP